MNGYVKDLLIDPAAHFGEPGDRRAIAKTALLDCCTVLSLAGCYVPGFTLSPLITSRADVDTLHDVDREGTWLLFQALDEGDLTYEELEHDTEVIRRYLAWIECQVDTTDHDH